MKTRRFCLFGLHINYNYIRRKLSPELKNKKTQTLRIKSKEERERSERKNFEFSVKTEALGCINSFSLRNPTFGGFSGFFEPKCGTVGIDSKCGRIPTKVGQMASLPLP
jgi:hypothetical protein